MNFLAHAYLSFGKEEVLIGNLITDFIRGKQRYDYSPEIQVGIALHHQIDEFTDSHPQTKIAREILHPSMGKYSGVFLDIIYDHFLAKDTKYFQPQTLKQFSQNTYHILDANYQLLPERFKYMFQYMKQQDWLASYQNKQGIKKAFTGMEHRAKYLEVNELFFQTFIDHYQLLKETYAKFIPELIENSENYLENIRIK